MMDRDEQLKRKREWMQNWRRNNPDSARAHDKIRRERRRNTRLVEDRKYYSEYMHKRRNSDLREKLLEQRRKSYHMNPEPHRERSRKFAAREDLKAHRKEYLKQWLVANQDKVKECNKRYAERRRTLRKKSMAKLREQVIQGYGGKCTCCGEKQIKFLALDHINNDGNEHRKEIGSTGIYFWARRNGYPKDKLQVLCHNCNMAKAFYGKCPHQEQIP